MGSDLTIRESCQYDACNRLVQRDIQSLRGNLPQTPQDIMAGGIRPEHTTVETYAYDHQGNLLRDGSRTYSYDACNRLSSVSDQSRTLIKNRYDSEGLRCETEENGRLVQFLFDGDKVIAEDSEEQGFVRYIRGYELVSSDSEKARTYYHYVSDELGSITHVLGEDGQICNQYEYNAF